ncbi:hypothetical protein POTOM_029925 [Populus tomentosa]|uniref:Uncharacterized protein n=1 Tax=Populus tomentosa TaxID=118781 RepID=A0A8X7ZDN3_POPTO|nr:hypothetical protein POTOM_029925 [Populus tomentosa]
MKGSMLVVMIESSSISTEENCHWAAAGGVETVMSPILQALNTPCFSDVPLSFLSAMSVWEGLVSPLVHMDLAIS